MSPVRIDKIFFQLWKIVVLGALSFFFGMRAWQLIFLTFKWRCTHQHSALVLAGAVSDGSEEQRYYVATPGISQSEVIMWLDDQSETSIMAITGHPDTHHILPWWQNTMKSANKRRQTLHHPMFIFTLFMLMYTDIRYPLFLFHSLPEFVPKMYLWRILVIDGNKRRWLIWGKSGIYRTFFLSFQNHL